MQAAIRFAEYAITGGVFWLSVLLFMTLLFFTPSGDAGMLDTMILTWNSWVTTLTKQLGTISGTVETLVMSLSVLVIFCSGLMLELISPYFFFTIELREFNKQFITKNQRWIHKLIERNAEFIGEDFREIQQEKSWKWNDPGRSFRQMGRYSRLKDFLLAYIDVFSSSSRVETLTDHIRLFRLSRSISMAMLILAILLSSFVLFSSSNTFSPGALTNIAIVAPIALLVVSSAITRNMYIRFCNTLSALTYNTCKNNLHMDEPAEAASEPVTVSLKQKAG